MKIAIITSGILPVPAVQGGAVENLIDFYLEYNDIHQLHDITIYSSKHPDTKKQHALKSKVNHYHYIDTNSFLARIRKRLYLRKAGGNELHHYSIEYFLERALKHIRKQTYDLIILENRPGYAVKLRKFTTADIVFHLHNDQLNYQTKYNSELYHIASRIITVSEYIKNRIRTINANDEKCTTVHNGIDIHAFTPNVYPIQLASIDQNDFIIVFSGRINKEKGIMELISAMNLIGREYPIKLVVLGSSFYGNATQETSFIRKLKEMATPIKERIIFTGFIPYSEIPRYLRIANIAIIPSVWDDPFPTTVLEAQAMGLPIITTRRGGIPEEVTEENAIMLETDEHFIDNLANAILNLYQNPEKRQAMAKASLERSKLFDKETYAKNFFAAIESII